MTTIQSQGDQEPIEAFIHRDVLIEESRLPYQLYELGDKHIVKFGRYRKILSPVTLKEEKITDLSTSKIASLALIWTSAGPSKRWGSTVRAFSARSDLKKYFFEVRQSDGGMFGSWHYKVYMKKLAPIPKLNGKVVVDKKDYNYTMFFCDKKTGYSERPDLEDSVLRIANASQNKILVQRYARDDPKYDTPTKFSEEKLEILMLNEQSESTRPDLEGDCFHIQKNIVTRLKKVDIPTDTSKVYYYTKEKFVLLRIIGNRSDIPLLQDYEFKVKKGSEVGQIRVTCKIIQKIPFRG